MASALALGLVTFGAVSLPTLPAVAQAEFQADVSLDYFHDRLSRFGDWGHDERWGDVWRPSGGRGFRPYYDGYWEYTDDYGWMWISEEPWADITYHYGRWVFDPEEGWLWVPGYSWGPAWVVWREEGENLGWFPMPPDYGDYDDEPYSGARYGWDDYYGYRPWYRMDRETFFGLWVFVDSGHFYRHDYRNFVIPSERRREIILRSRDTTRYSLSGNRFVNRSVDRERIEHAMHRPIEAQSPRRFMHSDVPMTSPSAGREIAHREHANGDGRHGPPRHDIGAPAPGSAPHNEPKAPVGYGRPAGGSSDGDHRHDHVPPNWGGGGNHPPLPQPPQPPHPPQTSPPAQLQHVQHSNPPQHAPQPNGGHPPPNQGQGHQGHDGGHGHDHDKDRDHH